MEDIWTCIYSKATAFSQIALKLTAKKFRRAKTCGAADILKSLAQDANSDLIDLALQLKYPAGELLIQIARHGSVAALINVGRKSLLNRNLAAEAARYGNSKTLEYLIKTQYQDLDIVCEIAARHGQLDCLKYAHKNGVELGDSWHEAMTGGHLDCLKYIIENDGRTKIEPFECTITDKQFECLKYAIEAGYDYKRLNLSIVSNNLQHTKYLRELGIEWDDYYPTDTIKANNLECFDYAISNGCPYNLGELFEQAAQINLSWVKKIFKLGAKITQRVVTNAIYTDKLDTLKWIYEQNPDHLRFKCCIYVQSLDCLKFLYEHGGEWGEQFCDNARVDGRYDLLKYAQEHGCPDEIYEIWPDQ